MGMCLLVKTWHTLKSLWSWKFLGLDLRAGLVTWKPLQAMLHNANNICHLKPPFSPSSMTQEYHTVLYNWRGHKPTNPALRMAEAAIQPSPPKATICRLHQWRTADFQCFSSPEKLYYMLRACVKPNETEPSYWISDCKFLAHNKLDKVSIQPANSLEEPLAAVIALTSCRFICVTSGHFRPFLFTELLKFCQVAPWADFPRSVMHSIMVKKLDAGFIRPLNPLSLGCSVTKLWPVKHPGDCCWMHCVSHLNLGNL